MEEGDLEEDNEKESRIAARRKKTLLKIEAERGTELKEKLEIVRHAFYRFNSTSIAISITLTLQE